MITKIITTCDNFSVNIDLFTDADYNSIDFEVVEGFLREHYPFVKTTKFSVIGFGKTFYIGNNPDEAVKLDLYYTDPFIDEIIEEDGIRLASVEEILAMKLDVISRGGRKRDFWDIHELRGDYTLEMMLLLHEKRYPYNHDEEIIRSKFIDFEKADKEYDPDCLRGNYWDFVKLDIIDFVSGMDNK